MKRTDWSGDRRSTARGRKALGALAKRRQKNRKSYSFERLEDRFYFSATPLDTQAVFLSSATPEGAAAILLQEQQWAAIQAGAGASQTTTQQLQTLSLPLPPGAPDDPLFPDQWHLYNTGQEVGNPDFQTIYGVAGQDINVLPVWNMVRDDGTIGYTGKGVLVAVIDTGVQTTHPDLAANISPTLAFNPNTGTNNGQPVLFDTDPATGGINPSAFHGTAVAGIIGAEANNGIGGTGVAPGVTLVPIAFITPDQPALPNSPDSMVAAFQYALEHGVDITNNSWGFVEPDGRNAVPITVEQYDILRDSATYGRNGLGMINVFSAGNDAGPAFFSAGNDAGPAFGSGFDGFGNYSSASYSALLNSRYVIGVTGVDHDGLYANSDGTFTSYPESGPDVLVAAPTGSNTAQDVANDTGQGSGLWTTDLVGDFGLNAAALPNGFDRDRDPLADPDYTSRFNGTSGSAAIVSGVVALMLEANPNLTWRDVQEILLRSARTTAWYESPESNSAAEAGPLYDYTTWQTNQTGPFRDPDPYFNSPPGLPPGFSDQTPRIYQDPLANPAINGNSPDLNPANSSANPSIGNDAGRQAGHYELMPGMFANGAGYTVSQGYGAFGDQIGYGHGVVDAELAVQMATQWDSLGQNLLPQTERTDTASLPIPAAGWNLPAAEKMADNGMLIPGGIGGSSGFSSYWNQYNAPSPGPFDPTNSANSPTDTRGSSYVDLVVPPTQEINVESVEVKLTITGNPANLDFLRIMLTSPDGTQSELNHYFSDPSFGSHDSQVLSEPHFQNDPNGNLTSGTFTWTFTTNRNWGESTNSALILDPVTGEPVVGPGGDPIFRNWELHIENWGAAAMNLAHVEVDWHGKPVAAPSQSGAFNPAWQIPPAQRIQGSVGIDSESPGEFNFNRYIQEENTSGSGGDYNASAPRADAIIRRPDYTDVNDNGIFDPGTDIPNQEDFAANIDVELFRVNKTTGQVETTPTAHFLTGADGNFYFDVDPTYSWVVRVVDPEGRAQLSDTSTAPNYMKHYQSEWTITPDWFFAPDHDNNPNSPSNAGNFDANGQQFKPGEILWGANDANGDGISTTGPTPFLMTDSSGTTLPPVPMAVQNINFLLRATPSMQQFEVKGSVYADLNNDGVFNGNDARLPNVTVYVDANRNGSYENGETSAVTDSNGNYTLQIPSSVPSTYSIGVRLPGTDWAFKQPGTGVQDVILPQEVSSAPALNFALTAPSTPNPSNPPPGSLGRVLGVVFNDLNGNGMRELNEAGAVAVRVFIDANKDGIWQSTEASSLTASNGSFVLDNITPASNLWIDVAIANEGTSNATLALTQPSAADGGHRVINVYAGGTVTNVSFGTFDRTGDDWGDLPLQTLAADNGPHHKVIPGFKLGDLNTGEVNGVPSATSSADTDDGVVVLGTLKPGVNTLQVTVHGVGGVLTGWMDFSGSAGFDGFDSSEQLVWTLNGNVLGKEAKLGEGTFSLQITIPAIPTTAAQRPIAARFRWGEPGLSFVGPAQIGEVEDYFLALNPAAGDYIRNGVSRSGASGQFDGVASLPAAVPPKSSVIQTAGAINWFRPDLLLLDQAWADADDTSYGHADDSFHSDQPNESVSTNDLALAAVLNDDGIWWTEI